MTRVVRPYGQSRARRERDVAESDVSIALGALFAGACGVGWIVGAGIRWELLAILGAIAGVMLAVEAAYGAR